MAKKSPKKPKGKKQGKHLAERKRRLNAIFKEVEAEAIEDYTARNFSYNKKAWNVVRRDFPQRPEAARKCLSAFYTKAKNIEIAYATYGRDERGRFEAKQPDTHFVQEFGPDEWSPEAVAQLDAIVAKAQEGFRSGKGAKKNVLHAHKHSTRNSPNPITGSPRGEAVPG
jgi:hypothetical protein